jgi:exosome complex RNA-binding protein Rrp4
MLKHSPTLNTVIMVEETLKGMDGSAVKISELKRALPKQINHNTLMTILEYLEESNKIAVGVRGITWVRNNNPNIRRDIRKGLEL